MIVIMSGGTQRLFGDGVTLVLDASAPLFHVGDPVRRMYQVVDGRVGLTRQTRAGAGVTLQQAESGHVIAEASAYADVYHCDARVIDDSVLRSVPVAAFRARLAQDPEAAEAWAAYLARAVQSARMRSEIRTLRTVAERLDAWLGETGTVPEKGTWMRLAGELGVTREALYRELSRRRRRG